MASQKTALLAPPGGPGGADPRIAILAGMLSRRDAVPYGAHRRFAREHFMELHDEYYLMHVARYRKYVDALALAPHYVLARIRQPVRAGRRRTEVTSERWFVIGVDYDTDMLWVNRIGFSPAVTDFSDVASWHGTTVYITDDAWFRRDVFGYDYDATGSEHTIEIPEGAPAPGATWPRARRDVTCRVQGDLIFRVSRFDPRDVLFWWAHGEINRYVRYLALDRIVAVLRDHGISAAIATERGSHVALIPGGTDGSRWSRLARKNRERVVRILGTYFNVDFDASADNGGTFASARIRDGQMEAWIEVQSVAYFGSPVGDTAIVVRDVSAPLIRDRLYEDLLTQFTALRPHDFVRHYGNHVLEFGRAIPVSLAYEPPIRPAVLEPVTLYISERDTYIVGRDSAITARHREHGTRTIRFAGRYCVHVSFLSAHPMDAVCRNRIALRRADARRAPRPA